MLMLDVTLFGIPIIVVIAVVVVVVAMIAFILYTFHVKHKVGRYSDDFAKAIGEFNSLCNPMRPMSNPEWEQFESAHSLDFEHANIVAGSKFIAWAVKDVANANTLVEIQNNHQETKGAKAVAAHCHCFGGYNNICHDIRAYSSRNYG